METETTSNSLKLFISYSHADEEHLKEFRKHLVTLRRNKVLSDWHDREMVSGDDFETEIKEELLSADLIVFMVSVDFLNSWYCYEVELRETLKRLKYNNIRIIPVVIRPCDWEKCDLSPYLAATKDGRPVSQYNNIDEAWVEVIKSIEKSAQKLLQTKKTEEKQPKQYCHQKDITLSKEFANQLSDTEVVFQHTYKENIFLEDIYVFPDISSIKAEYDEIERTINSDTLLSDKIDNKLLILGNEQIGKTSLAKMMFKYYHSAGALPVLCDGKLIKDIKVQKLLGKLLGKQYDNLNQEEYLKDSNLKILLIDDYDKSKLNIRYLPKFLEVALEIFDKLIIFSNSSLKYDENNFIPLSEFTQYEIMPFGHLRRGELIDKWNTIGQKETICIEELHSRNDDITRHINAIIRKNIIPPKPIYVLTVIQLLETTTQRNFELTSYGHCYQSLIQQALSKIGIDAKDFDLYLNYLTELAYYLFNTNQSSLDENLLGSFQKEYSDKYLIESHTEVFFALINAGILRNVNDEIVFRYRYIFYFYVAKYLADHLNNQSSKRVVKELCENTHTEKNANILIFLVHHSKDQLIIDEILFNSLVVFERIKEATLNIDETQYLLDFIKSLPDLVIEEKNIEKERTKSLEVQDEFEEVPCLQTSSEKDEEDEEEHDRIILVDINRSARLVEIIGQILRNRHGSLKKTQLYDLAESAYSTGLKFLSFYLTITRTGKDEILFFIRKLIREKTSCSNDEIVKETRNIFLMLCYGMSRETKFPGC